jgi:hypothetical protein
MTTPSQYPDRKIAPNSRALNPGHIRGRSGLAHAPRGCAVSAKEVEEAFRRLQARKPHAYS